MFFIAVSKRNTFEYFCARSLVSISQTIEMGYFDRLNVENVALKCLKEPNFPSKRMCSLD